MAGLRTLLLGAELLAVQVELAELEAVAELQPLAELELPGATLLGQRRVVRARLRMAAEDRRVPDTVGGQLGAEDADVVDNDRLHGHVAVLDFRRLLQLLAAGGQESARGE